MAIKSKKVRVTSQDRRKMRIRKRISGTDERPRLTVSKSDKHTYAQAVLDASGKTIAAASTGEKEVMSRIASISGEGFTNDTKSSKGMRAAKAVGLVLAERLKSKSITTVVFDRNGNLYHGRIRMVAEGAREGGLEF